MANGRFGILCWRYEEVFSKLRFTHLKKIQWKSYSSTRLRSIFLERKKNLVFNKKCSLAVLFSIVITWLHFYSIFKKLTRKVTQSKWYLKVGDPWSLQLQQLFSRSTKSWRYNEVTKNTHDIETIQLHCQRTKI